MHGEVSAYSARNWPFWFIAGVAFKTEIVGFTLLHAWHGGPAFIGDDLA